MGIHFTLAASVIVVRHTREHFLSNVFLYLVIEGCFHILASLHYYLPELYKHALVGKNTCRFQK